MPLIPTRTAQVSLYICILYIWHFLSFVLMPKYRPAQPAILNFNIHIKPCKSRYKTDIKPYKKSTYSFIRQSLNYIKSCIYMGLSWGTPRDQGACRPPDPLPPLAENGASWGGQRTRGPAKIQNNLKKNVKLFLVEST